MALARATALRLQRHRDSDHEWIQANPVSARASGLIPWISMSPFTVALRGAIRSRGLTRNSGFVPPTRRDQVNEKLSEQTE
jgi:hypothetical protein